MSFTLVPNRPLASEPVTEDLFQSLVAEWTRETAFKSNLTEVIKDPAFRQIVALGHDAVPFLLRELTRKPSYLVFALDEITKENPVPASATGKVTEMVNAWLSWGEKKGLLG